MANSLSPFVYEMHSDRLIVLDWFGTNYKVGKIFVKFLDGTTIGGPWSGFFFFLILIMNIFWLVCLILLWLLMSYGSCEIW